MMIHDTNNKGSAKIKMKMDKDDLSTPVKMDNNKLTSALITRPNNDCHPFERVEENTNTKNKGVWYNARTRCWLTCVKGTGRHLRVFSVKKYGYKQAKLLALECKNSMYVNEEESQKKQEQKEELTSTLETEHIGNGGSYCKGELQESVHSSSGGTVIDHWGSELGENETCNNSNTVFLNENEKNGKCKTMYIENSNNGSSNTNQSGNRFLEPSASIIAKFNNDDNGHATNTDTDHTNSCAYKITDNNDDSCHVDASVVLPSSSSNVDNINNATPSTNANLIGNSSCSTDVKDNINNDDCVSSNSISSTGDSKINSKKGSKKGYRNMSSYESENYIGQNKELQESTNNSSSSKANSEEKEINNCLFKEDENDLNNRRYNTRKGSLGEIHDIKRLKGSIIGDNHSTDHSTTYDATRHDSRCSDSIKTVAEQINSLSFVKKRKHAVNENGKNSDKNTVEESEQEQSGNEKGVTAKSNNYTTQNCLITEEDFQLDTPETTDTEQYFFCSAYSSDMSQRRVRKKKKYKQNENGSNYIFTNVDYSDSKYKSETMECAHKNRNFHSCRSNNNAPGSTKNNLKMCNAIQRPHCFNCNIFNRQLSCNHTNNCCCNGHDIRNGNKVFSNNRQKNSNKQNGSGEHGCAEGNKENKERKKSITCKAEFLKLSRDALILILKDLKTNVIPKMTDENGKKERYANTIRLIIKNTKKTQHFSEMEPYLQLFSECIKNSKLPSNMEIQEIMAYLEKL